MDDTKSYSFSEALNPPTHEVCSIILKPFCLGHWTFLEFSPLLSPDIINDNVYDNDKENLYNSIRHILLFLIVCAHTFEDCKRMDDDMEFFKQVKDEFEAGIGEYIKKTNSWNIHMENRKIREYLNYYIGPGSMPNFSERGSPSPPSGLDWKSNIYSVLKNECGYSESHIMNMNMRRVWVEWITIMAKSGAIIVKTNKQLEQEKKAKEFVDKIRKGEIPMPEFVRPTGREKILCQ